MFDKRAGFVAKHCFLVHHDSASFLFQTQKYWCLNTKKNKILGPKLGISKHWSLDVGLLFFLDGLMGIIVRLCGFLWELVVHWFVCVHHQILLNSTQTIISNISLGQKNWVQAVASHGDSGFDDDPDVSEFPCALEFPDCKVTLFWSVLVYFCHFQHTVFTYASWRWDIKGCLGHKFNDDLQHWFFLATCMTPCEDTLHHQKHHFLSCNASQIYMCFVSSFGFSSCNFLGVNISPLEYFTSCVTKALFASCEAALTQMYVSKCPAERIVSKWFSVMPKKGPWRREKVAH